MPTAAQRQVIVTVDGIPGQFATMSGGNVVAAATMVWNGGATTPEIIAAPATTADIKVDKPYDPVVDQPFIAQLRPLVGRFRTTVTTQDCDPDMTPTGQPVVYASALLTTLDPPDYDASSGKERRWGMTFSVRAAAGTGQ